MSMTRTPRLLGALTGLLLATKTVAAGLPAGEIDEIVVLVARSAFVGPATSASQGIVLAEQIADRPVLRPAEVLEVVPGLVVTQHSGDGKANQYFLRGFNLDHGTDFAARVDGVPVNMPTNAHGQGYSDLNFLIPELIDRIEYKKGTYYAEEGDFSAAGSADIRYKRRIDTPMIVLSAGREGYRRALLAGAPAIGDGDLLLAAESFENNGPWDNPEGYRRIGGIAKFTRGDASGGYSLEALASRGSWHSTDQIPRRAVLGGTISRYGAIDPTDGGTSQRLSLSVALWQPAGDGKLHASLYGMDSRLDLLSDFTYATDPVHGDQFEQNEQRRVVGGALRYESPSLLGDSEGTFRAGAEFRRDQLSPVGLYRTVERVRYDTIREDRVRETSTSLYVSEGIQWLASVRTEAGLRVDRLYFGVDSNLAANSGTATASVASPKLTLVFGPWSKTEYFINFGRGFHSNDARGATISVDPVGHVTPVDRVSPIARAAGYEVGIRSAIVPDLQLSVSLWTLQLDSELVYGGDTGTTNASGRTRRTGVEGGAFYTPFDGAVIDADYAWTHARFIESSSGGFRVPNAVESVASLGLTFKRPSGWYGGLRLRYFGPASLAKDDQARSSSTFVVNIESGIHLTPTVSVSASVLNVLDRHDNDITYYYASQLRGETAPVTDYHFHPVEPRSVRVSLAVHF